METKELFRITADGYSCEEVEKYIERLKAEYKKIHEYAKTTETNNEKLKKICRALKEENESLKESVAGTGNNKEVNEGVVTAVDNLSSIMAQAINEIKIIKDKLQ